MTAKKPGGKKLESLKRLRKALSITQRALAELIGVSTGAIVALEAGYLDLSPKTRERIIVLTGYDPQTGELVDIESYIKRMLLDYEAKLRSRVANCRKQTR